MRWLIACGVVVSRDLPMCRFVTIGNGDLEICSEFLLIFCAGGSNQPEKKT